VPRVRDERIGADRSDGFVTQSMRVLHLQRAQQRFVMHVINTALAQQDR